MTPDLRFTELADDNAQCIQSALPSAVRFTTELVVLTLASRLPLSPSTVSVTSILSSR